MRAKESAAGVVWLVVSPLVMRYRSGRCNFGGSRDIGGIGRGGGILFGAGGKLGVLLKGLHSLLEMKDLPKGDPDVQQTDAGNSATHPAGSNYSLQRLHAGYPDGVQEKIILAPIAHAERALRNPRQERQKDADLQAENDIENDAELRRHIEPVNSKW